MKNRRWVIFAALLLCSTIFITPAPQSKTGSIASLEKQLPALKGKGLEEINALLELAQYYRSRSPQKTIGYCDRILNLPEAEEYPSERGHALLTKSDAYAFLSRSGESLKCRKEALDIFKKAKDRQGTAKALNALGAYYYKIGYYNLALRHNQAALKIFEEDRNMDQVLTSYWHLGNLYLHLENFERALRYFEKALTVIDEMGQIERRPIFLHNAAIAHQSKGNYKKALEYFQLSLTGFKKKGDKYWIASCLDNIGLVYSRMEQPGKGLEYLLESEQLQKITGKKTVDFYTLLYTGDLYRQKKNYPEANAYLARARALANKTNNLEYLKFIFKSYEELYAAQDNFKEAYRFSMRYWKIHSRLINKKKNDRLAELEVKFNLERRNRQITALENENRLRVSERNVFVLGFLLVLLVAVLFFKKFLHLFIFWKKQKYISQYRLMKKVGTGGMGTVFLARSIRNKNKIAAVKVIKDELAEDEINRQRFKREGMIIDQLNHPNIVKIHERGEAGGKLFIVMEYLDGITLDHKISRDGALPVDQAVEIMTAAADALAFIHDKKIIHRDLKPSNIMLLENESGPKRVKLLDFGMAMMKSHTRLTQSGALVGTIQYISPERITGGVYSTAGDIYSLGITFHEMLTGEPVFGGESITTVIERILDVRPEPPIVKRNTIPARLNQLVMDMLTKEPGKRPTAHEVISVLSAISP